MSQTEQVISFLCSVMIVQLSSVLLDTPATNATHLIYCYDNHSVREHLIPQLAISHCEVLII